MMKFTLPLFWKFTIAIMVIVTLFGTINVMLIWNTTYNSLEDELNERAIFIAKSTAEKAISPLLYHDLVTLQNLVSGINKIDQGVEYAFIMNEERTIISHTFEKGVPRELIAANTIGDKMHYNIINIKPKNTENKILKDIAVPILDGKIGIVRIGLKTEKIQADTKKAISTLLIMVGIFLLAGIAGSFFFSYVITKPIKTICNIAENIDIKSLSTKQHEKIVPSGLFYDLRKKTFRIEDELDLLVTKFNDMLERLTKTYTELQSAQSSLLQSEKLASIGILASGIAHEINNPIAGIKNCIRRINKAPNDVDQINRYLDMMTEAADKAEKAIQGLLDFSRKHDFVFQNVKMELIIENALSLAAFRLEKENILIKKQYHSFSLEFNGSRNHLEQVILNLILNSADAINE